MKDCPLVSVCVAIYNTEKYLRQCLDTIVNQTYKNLEIILVDDKTPDNAGNIVDEYVKQDRRITAVHHAKNQGLSEARNTGIENSTGEYVTFVDSDDYLALDYVEYLLKVINETQADIALSRNFFTSQNNRQIKKDSISIHTPEDILCDISYNRIHVGVWNRLYKRELIEKYQIRFRALSKTGEGMHFNYDIMPKANSIGVGLKKIYTYRLDNTQSATKKPNIEKQAIGAIENIEDIKNTISLRSQKLNIAVEYQYWTSTLYALSHILLTRNGKNDYSQLYKHCVTSTRKAALSTLRGNLSCKQKLKSMLVWISPVLTVRLSIFYRRKLGFGQKV